MASLLTAVDGGPIPPKDISAAFLGVVQKATASMVIEVAPGSELLQAGSHTGLLRDTADPTRMVFLKKVTASLVANKPWNDRRRVLLYVRNEVRFYGEFAAILASRGVRTPSVSHMVSNHLDGIEEYEDEPPSSLLANCGALMFMEPVMDPARYMQTSPLSPSQASQLLAAAATLHAAAWEDEALLRPAAERLQRHGGSFALSARNPKELANLPASWERFVAAFTPSAPLGFFARPEIATLGTRLQALAPWIAAQLSPMPTDRYATLVHGDLKAMNVFLPVEPTPVGHGHGSSTSSCSSGSSSSSGNSNGGATVTSGGTTTAATTATAAAAAADEPVLIDFASTGVGVGMADVAMHLVHALVPSDLDNGGEEALVDHYLAALERARSSNASRGLQSPEDQQLRPYPREQALRHYRLAICDYGRFVMGRFWGSATPESFRKAAASPNVVLVNRNFEAALRFIERIHECLAGFEKEIQ